MLLYKHHKAIEEWWMMMKWTKITTRSKNNKNKSDVKNCGGIKLLYPLALLLSLFSRPFIVFFSFSFLKNCFYLVLLHTEFIWLFVCLFYILQQIFFDVFFQYLFTVRVLSFFFLQLCFDFFHFAFALYNRHIHPKK